MKRTVPFILLAIILNCPAMSQQFNNCKYTYFKNKQVSTSTCYDKDNRWGKAIAYNKQGAIIREWELRKIAGHSSIDFTFYPDGAIHVARWHSAPDGGIQWYNTETTFSNTGQVISETHNDYDESPAKYVIREPAVTKPAETVKCAEIYNTVYYYINRCPFPVTVTRITPGNNQHESRRLKPGDTVKGGDYILAEQFADITQVYSFSVAPTGKQTQCVATRWLPVTQPGRSVRQYMLVAEPF